MNFLFSLMRKTHRILCVYNFNCHIRTEWKEITSSMYRATNALNAIYYKPSPYLMDKLILMTDKLENIQRALEEYLETKRQLFPRFYFISNDDLLEVSNYNYILYFKKY